MKNVPALKEAIVAANEGSLNHLIAENHINPASIVAIIYQPAGALAIGDYEAKYRVVYQV